MAETTAGPLTAELGEFAAGLTFDAIPADLVTHMKRCVLDTVGCGVYGASLEWSRILRSTLLEVDGTGVGRLLGAEGLLSAPHSALVNGSAIHAFEIDDLHPRSIVHPGSVVLPAALAAADVRGGVTGRELVTALVAGYEVSARVGNSVGAAHLRQGYHPTATHGTIGAAVAAASILGLDADRTVHAMGIAGTQAAGLMAAQYSSMVKRFHAGRAAQSGVYGALLAANGYTGIDNLFEAEYGGYGPTMSPEYDDTELTRGLGETWESRLVGFKPYSTNGSCHPTIDALLAMREEHGLRPEMVGEIRIEASTATKAHVGWEYTPGSVTTAQMNLGYIAAAVLTDGDAFVRQFSPERIVDPELVSFAHRVHVAIAPDIDAEGDGGRHHTRIAVHLRDGRVLTDDRAFARGSSRRPMTEDELRAKFDKLTQDLVGAERSAALMSTIDDLDEAPSLDSLWSGMGGSALV
ncbi:MmgE/PrpD family protein [Nocardioides sp. zg-536]|uniref:MmgE/PrpD family protein n=1 Tax=Nocardioides faecalis TaxID=2803858 RepID=A0A938Y5C5_9ACTN|nr:MmgE/PrpD family protein [Nocardioides faecalis]MBM9460338.1 MmgE/PrpD family protein [Nocardioides faecalis]MBS4751263.1 MmgE/PrpD family protein [Nocardioides faecalis]QVI59834.1 MmgE/PrpD family protein [Nocardioides faecalis]